MERAEITQKIKDILADKLVLEQDEINMDSHVNNDLGADSLDVVEIIMDLETEFKIPIPDEDAEGIRTVKDMVDLIDNKIN